MQCSRCPRPSDSNRKGMCIPCYQKEWRSRNLRDQYTLANRFQKLKQGAKIRNIELLITVDDYKELAASSLCFYCGDKSFNQTGGGLDRKDNSKPYTKKNLVAACAGCNKFKHNRINAEEMVEVVKLLRKMRKKPKGKIWVPINVIRK